MGEITNTLNVEQLQAAHLLRTGAVIYAYEHKGLVRMNTEHGPHTYEWRNGEWCEPLDVANH